MPCRVHCPVPRSASGRALAAVAVTGAILAAINAVLGAIIVAASCTVAVLVVAGVIGFRFALRHAGGRMNSRAELLSATRAVRAVPADQRAIAARARPPRRELAAPAVQLIEVRPAATEKQATR